MGPCPDVYKRQEHTEFLHLLAQFLDVVADDAVIDVHIGAVVEQVQGEMCIRDRCGALPESAHGLPEWSVPGHPTARRPSRNNRCGRGYSPIHPHKRCV